MTSSPALHSLGRWPLLLPLLGAIGGILTAELVLWPLLVLALVVGVYYGVDRRKPTYLAGAVAALILSVIHHERLERRAELANQMAEQPELVLIGTVTESNAAGLVRRLFKTESGARVNLIGLPEQFQTGQRLILFVEPIKRPTARNPSGWTPNETLWRKGLAGSAKVLSAQQIGWQRGFPTLRGWSEAIRATLIERVTSGIRERESADIVQAVILGEKPSGSRAFEDFRKTGTMHVFAVSGLHVGLVATIVFGIGWALRIPPRFLLWLVILSMFGYAFITGLRPPALRASLMGSLVLGRFLLYRRSTVFNNLFAAGLVVLAIDSFQFWQPGFQLSFLVVAVILLVEPHLWKRVEPLLAHDPFLPRFVWTRWQHFTHWCRSKLGKMATVSCAAWAGSAPLSFAYFGWFTPIAAFASILMVMVAFLILTLAFCGLLLGSFSRTAGDSLNQANGFLAKMAQNSSTGMSKWPGASNHFDPPAPWRDGLCVFDISFGGAAIHLDAGGGVLIDAGDRANFWWDVNPALQAHGLSLDSIIATHNDSSHISGLVSAIRSYPVKQALIPSDENRYSLATLTEIATEEGTRIFKPAVGQQLPIDERTTLEILAVGDSSFERADDRGLVIMIRQDGWKILVTADAGYETEQSLLESQGDIDADVWICGRNEKDAMGQDAFVRAVSPAVIIASEQAYPISEQIPKSWRAWLESEGVFFYSQREEGAVFVRPGTTKLIVESFLTEKKTHLIR